MNILFGYFLLGLSLAAPIGPINAAQIDRGIRSGFLRAWFVGIGAMLADIVFMLLVYFGVIHFLNIPFMQTFLWLFGFFILCYTGIEALLHAGRIRSGHSGGDESLAKSFLTGFLMSISNPLSILFWLGIYGSVLAEAAAKYETHELLALSASLMSGILLWDCTMAVVASTFRRFLTSRLLVAISVISGLSLIGFGLYFGHEAYRALFG